ncbi:DUF1707 SHOCT-like domain-containing protein [Actinopolymorpha alba]|uniref:DUF1707 SHOCT-like domain-containing protein n=1 Tax=Actinopolymorpha alba TaxID=533267 RepID=UPI00036133DF|nr:DUF1707 domain-containing protein [Actinopolymorpha alba]
MTDNLPDRALHRASDSDREAVVEHLQAAAADGRLDLTEFEERMAEAYRAKTFGELAPLTADLPETAAHAGPPEITLHAVGSSVNRSGNWVVPRKVVVKGKAGTTRLDLTQATLLSREVEIALDAVAGSLVVIVPPDTHVDASELRTSFGSVNIRTDTTPGSGGAPRLKVTITGSAHMGSVVVRHLYFWEPWIRNVLLRWRRALQSR